MIEIKNQFVRHSMFWMWVLPFALFLLLPAFVDREEMHIPAAELQMMQEVLGQDVDAITHRADKVFDSLFIETGLVKWSGSLFTSKIKEDDPKFFRNLAKSSHKYHDNLWFMVYRAIWRLSGLWPTFLALMLAVAVPALVDGVVVGAKKADVFKPLNPVFFWSAGHTLVMVIGVFGLLPLLPYAISVHMLYASIAAIAGALWVTASNLQTGGR